MQRGPIWGIIKRNAGSLKAGEYATKSSYSSTQGQFHHLQKLSSELKYKAKNPGLHSKTLLRQVLGRSQGALTESGGVIGLPGMSSSDPSEVEVRVALPSENGRKVFGWFLCK